MEIYCDGCIYENDNFLKCQARGCDVDGLPKYTPRPDYDQNAPEPYRMVIIEAKLLDNLINSLESASDGLKQIYDTIGALDVVPRPPFAAWASIIDNAKKSKP